MLDSRPPASRRTHCDESETLPCAGKVAIEVLLTMFSCISGKVSSFTQSTVRRESPFRYDTRAACSC